MSYVDGLAVESFTIPTQTPNFNIGKLHLARFHLLGYYILANRQLLIARTELAIDRTDPPLLTLPSNKGFLPRVARPWRDRDTTESESIVPFDMIFGIFDTRREIFDARREIFDERENQMY